MFSLSRGWRPQGRALRALSLSGIFALCLAVLAVPASGSSLARAGEGESKSKVAPDLTDPTGGGKLSFVKLGDSPCIAYEEKSYFSIMQSSTNNRSHGPKLKDSEIKTWTEISKLPKELQDLLHAWDRSTTEEDIRAICGAETSPILGKLPDGSKRWMRAEYLLTLKEWIKAGKVPFTFTLKTRAESTNSNGSVTLGYVAHMVRDKDGNQVSTNLVVPEGGSVEYHMGLVKENFEDFATQAKLMKNGGGFAVLFVRNRYGLESSSLATFFHEVTHVLDSVYRVQYNQEASPEANKLFFLGCISQRDYERHFAKKDK